MGGRFFSGGGGRGIFALIAGGYEESDCGAEGCAEEEAEEGGFFAGGEFGEGGRVAFADDGDSAADLVVDG